MAMGMIAAPAQKLAWTRLLLITSAVFALVSVGMSVFRSTESAPPPVAAETAPDIDEVIRRLEERLKQEPSSAEGWKLLGWAYSQGGRPADAIGAYRRATALAPDQAELWSALGEALVVASPQGFPEEARTAFTKALSLDSNNFGARFFLGAAKVEGGDANGAVNDWIALLKDAPPGAPWAAAIRQKIEEVATANKIDIAGRLPPVGEPGR